MSEGWPQETPPWTDARGFERVGRLVEVCASAPDLALYYFPGDAVAGDAFEVYFWRDELRDRDTMREAMTGEGKD